MVMKKRKGFMNIFFLGGLLVMLLCTLVLTDEASRMRLKRRELEKMLVLDYRTEAYYLLLKSGSINNEYEIAYGSFTGYELVEERTGENYVRIDTLENKILITGYFRGVERCFYEIQK